MGVLRQLVEDRGVVEAAAGQRGAGALVAAGMTMDNLVVGRTGDPVW